MWKRTDTYSILKVCATIFVVFAHATIMYTDNGAISMGISPVLVYITNFIYAFHMPLYMFLSGAIYRLCINCGKYKSTPEFLIKKARRLLIPYFIFGILYVSPVMIALNLTELSLIEFVQKGIILSLDARHLWFLCALFTAFVITKLIQPVLDRVQFTLPILMALAVIVSAKNYYFPAVFSIINSAKFYCYFLFGYAFEASPKVKSFLCRCWWLGFPLLGVFLLGRGAGSLRGIVMAMIGIMICYCFASRFGDCISGGEVFQHIQRNGMGIYLFHPMIIYICFYQIRDVGCIPSIAAVSIAVFAFVLSDFLTVLVRRAGLQIILGEYGQKVLSRFMRKLVCRF